MRPDTRPGKRGFQTEEERKAAQECAEWTELLALSGIFGFSGDAGGSDFKFELSQPFNTPVAEGPPGGFGLQPHMVIEDSWLVLRPLRSFSFQNNRTALPLAILVVFSGGG